MTQIVDASFDTPDGETPRSQAARIGFACVLGDEHVVIRRNLFRGPATQNSNTLVLSAGSGRFTAKAELERLLRQPPMYSEAQLESARRAAGRLNSRSDEDLVRLAEALSEDITRFCD
jgi:hypothetical protein